MKNNRKKKLLPSTLLERHAKRIRLVLADVDGVLTDGKLYYVPDGKGGIVEAKGFNSQDGMGFRWLQEAGIPAGWISGRESPGVVARAQILQLSYLYQNHLAKVGPYEEVMEKAGVVDEEVCFVGDDLTDAPLLARCGLAVAVANAVPELKAQAHYVTKTPGGQGALREVIEIVLKAQGHWDQVLRKYGLPAK
jgi:3-deoxy-D-manno-octulosonate 8-phosphate phosphatase (KDO 8-P phosphatase)